MWLAEIEADRLRNLKAVRLELPKGLTIVSGKNGQGKSSLLESIYMLATGRSFRTRIVKDVVSRDGGPLRVVGTVHNGSTETRLAVMLDDQTRHLLVEGVDRELADYLGRLGLIDLTTERMQVLRGSPNERRRFLDRGVAGLQPTYLNSLGEYRRVLAQRNALLRKREATAAELAAWDERLVVAAFPLHNERRRYAMSIATRLGEIGRALLADGPELRLRYRPSPSKTAERPPAEFETLYREGLEQSRKRDFAVGHTCYGPHRDELMVELDGADLRRFGSAGQLRAAMVALKLAKLGLLREERGTSPLFLMDDFDSDLDEARAAAVAGFLREGGFQALVATSKPSLVRQFGVASLEVRMDEGTVNVA